MRPLTPAEKQFAAENHALLYAAMNRLRIPIDCYGEAAEAYCAAVRSWLSRPDLQSKYKFGTILAYKLRGACCRITEYQRLESSHTAYSLDALTPAGICWAEITPSGCVSPEDQVSDLESTLRQQLSSKEDIVLSYLLLGYRQVEIGRKLNLSKEAVYQRLKKIRKKVLQMEV